MQRFLILRIGGVGDTLLLLPFISALRQTYPESYLEFIGYPERIQIFKDFGYVDEIKSFDQPGMDSFFVKESNLPEKLVKYFGKFDIIFAFFKDGEGIFNHNLQKCNIEKFYLFSPYPNENMHILDYYQNLSHSLGLKKINQFENRFLCPSTSSSPQRGEGSLSDEKELAPCDGRSPGRVERRTAATHPSAGSKKKCWSPKYFAEIIDWLEEKYGINSLLISGPADEEVTREVISHLKKTKPKIIKNLTLTELALLLNHCSFYLGNDSGITHLSAFTGIPTIAIFNQEKAKIWSPRGENVHLCVSDNLDKISPIEIKEKIEKLITAIIQRITPRA